MEWLPARHGASRPKGRVTQTTGQYSYHRRRPPKRRAQRTGNCHLATRTYVQTSSSSFLRVSHPTFFVSLFPFPLLFLFQIGASTNNFNLLRNRGTVVIWRCWRLLQPATTLKSALPEGRGLALMRAARISSRPAILNRARAFCTELGFGRVGYRFRPTHRTGEFIALTVSVLRCIELSRSPTNFHTFAGVLHPRMLLRRAQFQTRSKS